nr:serine--tRNA ligase [Candidatus Gracilibacteria bacterium]
MIDLKKLKADIDSYKQVLKDRNLKIDLDEFLDLDKKRLELQSQIDELKNKRNIVSKEIPKLAPSEKQMKIEEMKKVGDEITCHETTITSIEERWTYIYHRLPNFLDSTTAIGPDDSGNKVESKYKDPTKFDFAPKTHYEIGEKKGWIDTEKGAQISGARFWYIKGDLALLNMAIINYAVNKLNSRGFQYILPPVLVREEAMFGTGFLPAGEDGVYRVNPEEDNLYLVGTAEVPVTSYHAGEILNLNSPIKYVGQSSCFRREAGSYGKDMKGILRGHQFEKVEMVVFCKQEDSQKMHNEMVAVEEEVWQGLGIPYQKVNICSGDLGNPALKKYDLEAWMPGEGKYREVTSCSNVGEYQSRRLGIRYKDEEGNTKYAHTLNGTVIALSRCLIAVIENYQTVDGNVIIPEILRPYIGGRTEI